MRKEFFIISTVILLLTAGAIFLDLVSWPVGIFVLFLFSLGVHDLSQKNHAVTRNFPVIGHFRFLFEMVRPEIQQYFVESDTDGKPISRETRSSIYQRAKGDLQTVPFGTLHDLSENGKEWVYHSLKPQHIDPRILRVTIGGKDTLQTYSSSVFNISAMSYGSLSKNAVMALNKGAKEGGFFHNTGEGGISPYHEQGGDLVWQIGTGYFGCRDEEGRFNPDLFESKAKKDAVKMIEVKLSQGAKPGHGGILPAAKVTDEIARIREVPKGKDVLSPSAHTAFDTPIELLKFVRLLRKLSGGKPVGIKLCIGARSDFFALCKAMVRTAIRPDFITVDGAEGGTGAAPLEFTNFVGMPLNDAIAFVHDALVGFGIRDDIKIIASGKIFNGFDIVTKLALGADICVSARGMMLALGCIQALRCNTNACPVGVATTKESLVRGLNVEDKSKRVAKYQKEIVTAFAELLGSMGYSSPGQLQRGDIKRRMDRGTIMNFSEIYPPLKPNFFLDLTNMYKWPVELRKDYRLALPERFGPPSIQELESLDQ